jgi:hypothetical protein
MNNIFSLLRWSLAVVATLMCVGTAQATSSDKPSLEETTKFITDHVPSGTVFGIFITDREAATQCQRPGQGINWLNYKLKQAVLFEGEQIQLSQSGDGGSQCSTSVEDNSSIALNHSFKIDYLVSPVDLAANAEVHSDLSSIPNFARTQPPPVSLEGLPAHAVIILHCAGKGCVKAKGKAGVSAKAWIWDQRCCQPDRTVTPLDEAQDEVRIFVGDEAMAVRLKAAFENLILLKGGKKDPF